MTLKVISIVEARRINDDAWKRMDALLERMKVQAHMKKLPNRLRLLD